jgi:Mg2+-importing ATPase
MVVFGITSSVFDYLTFGTLLLILPGMTEEFRTGWFMESVISASMIVLVVRAGSLSSRASQENTAGSYPAYWNLYSHFPSYSFATPFGFKPLPVSVIIILEPLWGFTSLQLSSKKDFYKRVKL